MSLRELMRRFALGAVVGGIATLAYQTTQHASLARAIVRETCWSWTWLPFHVAWFWPYVSMFVLVGVTWFFVPTWQDARRFAVCVLATGAVGWVTFMVYPTACARPPVDGQPIYYATLMALDRPNNCLPCLHSAFTVLAAIVLAATRYRTFVERALLWGAVAVICVSIVGLRQHTDLDTAAGALLGALAGWWFTRDRAPLQTPLPRD